MRNRSAWGAAVFAIAIGPLAGPTIAADKTPRIDGRLSIEIQNDWSYRSEIAGAEQNDLYATIEPELTVSLIHGLTLHTKAVFEPVQEFPLHEDRVFDDHGAHIQELYIDYTFGPVGVRGGKFTPRFGIAWNRAPGVYGSDVAEVGYEFSERIGVETRAKLSIERYGEHELAASTFFRDTSPLARSIVTGRGEPSLADGGVGNTEELNSFAVALNGGDLLGFAGLEYHIGYINQAPGVGVQEREDGFALALARRYRLGPNAHWFEPMAEYVWFRDADGVPDRDRSFFTIGGQSHWKAWNLAIAYTHAVTTFVGGAESVANQFQISMGYEFSFGLSIDVGWRSSELDGADSRAAGLLVAYGLTF